MKKNISIDLAMTIVRIKAAVISGIIAVGMTACGVSEEEVPVTSNDITENPSIEEIPGPVLNEDIYGKYICEKPGFGGIFTVMISDDGTFNYYEGGSSSYIGSGDWELSENRLLLKDTGYGEEWNIFFNVEDGCLVYDKDSSHPFIYVDLIDGARFIPEERTDEAWIHELEERILEEERERISMNSGSGDVTNVVDGGINSHNDRIGLSLSLSDITSTGCTLIFSQHGGNVSGFLTTGSPFDIQTLNDNGEWEDVPLAESESYIVWTDEGWFINNNQDTFFREQWEYYYGNLPDGHYRIHKEIMDFRVPGDYDLYDLYAEFDLPGSVLQRVYPIGIPSDIVINGVSISSGEGIVSCECDFDGDGKTETVTADYSQILTDGDAVPGAIMVCDEAGKNLWSSDFGLPYAGWRSFYIAEMDGAPYLVEYFPPTMRQGSWDCAVAIYTFDSADRQVMMDEYVCNGSKEDADKCEEKAAKYLEKSVLLISTMNSELKVFVD